MLILRSASIGPCLSISESYSRARWSGNYSCVSYYYNKKKRTDIRLSYLDNGVELTLKRGDVCVQRGTIHGWENKTDKPARIYFVLTGKSCLLEIIMSFNYWFYDCKPPTRLMWMASCSQQRGSTTRRLRQEESNTAALIIKMNISVVTCPEQLKKQDGSVMWFLMSGKYYQFIECMWNVHL